MRLGLIGTGKQGQRYLQEKNGGRHIVVSGSRRIPLDGVDGVIIATHPAGHKELALECIAAGKAVLIEKPLALNLRDCMDIIDASQKAGVPLNVAHLDCWAWPLPDYPDPNACAVITYAKHDRDYSPWLDWAPHGLALLDKVGACRADNVSLSKGERSSLTIRSSRTGGTMYTRRDPLDDMPTPMFLAVRGIKTCSDWDHHRRVYRALFAE